MNKMMTTVAVNGMLQPARLIRAGRAAV